MAGPDFIGIGLQKGGTRWLYEQLSRHPDFWLPPLKEFHFFDGPFPSPKALAQIARRVPASEADRIFLDRVRSMAPSRDHGVAAYVALFDMAGGRLTGEITPAYSILPERQVAGLARAMPATRAILMLRDPVDRAWSFLNDAVNDGHLPPEVVREPEAMLAALAEPGTRGRSFPSEIHARWSPHFELMMPFFEDVVGRPAELREDVARFLGARTGVDWGADPVTNSKAGRARAPRTPALAAALAGHFREEILACAARFGGPARDWPAKHGLT